MSKHNGLKRLIDEAAAEGRPFDPAPRQLVLDALAPLPDDEGEAVVVPAGREGPGRPPGARNRRTEEIARYIGARYGLPLERLAQIWSITPPELATLWGIDKDKAADIWLAAIRASLEYLHQKMPQAVELKGELREVILHLYDKLPAEEKGKDYQYVVDGTAEVLDVPHLDAPKKGEGQQ